MQLFHASRKLSASLAFFAIALASLVPAEHAVAQNRTIATADIPFDFLVGSGKLPAGHYQVVKVTGNVLMLRSVEGNHMQNVMTIDASSARKSEHGRLVFRRYGSHYFLANLWIQGSRDGLEITKTRAEKEMLATMAPPEKVPTGTEIALNQLP